MGALLIRLNSDESQSRFTVLKVIFIYLPILYQIQFSTTLSATMMFVEYRILFMNDFEQFSVSNSKNQFAEVSEKLNKAPSLNLIMKFYDF